MWEHLSMDWTSEHAPQIVEWSQVYLSYGPRKKEKESIADDTFFTFTITVENHRD